MQTKVGIAESAAHWRGGNVGTGRIGLTPVEQEIQGRRFTFEVPAVQTQPSNLMPHNVTRSRRC